jgi:hypothetical protein
MNRRLTYAFGLVGFLLMWGVFGFAAGAQRNPPQAPATLAPVENTPVIPEATSAAGIPVTGKPAPLLTEVVVFYGLIGLTASFLILGLLSLANKTAAHYVQPDDPSRKKNDEE